jgi:hypothetical protein
MGQRTLAFTKQMLRVFNFVEPKELDHLVAEAWPSIPRSSKNGSQSIRDAKRRRTGMSKQTYTYA